MPGFYEPGVFVSFLITASLLTTERTSHNRAVMIVTYIGLCAVAATFGAWTHIPRELTLVLFLLTGLLDGTLQVALFSFGSTMPPIFIAAINTGVGTAGFAAAGLKLITKAALPNTDEGLEASSMLYFFIGSAMCAVCALLAAFFHKLPVVSSIF